MGLGVCLCVCAGDGCELEEFRGVMCQGLGQASCPQHTLMDSEHLSSSRAGESQQTWCQGHFMLSFPDQRLFFLHEDSQAFSSQHFFFPFIWKLQMFYSEWWVWSIVGLVVTQHELVLQLALLFFCVLLIFTLQTRASICFPRMALFVGVSVKLG